MSIIQGIGAAVLIAVIGYAYWLGGTNARAEHDVAVAKAQATAEKAIAESAKAEFEASERARKAEQALQTAVDEVAAKYEQEKTDAKTSADRLIADLRAGNVRLRQLWRDERATDRLSDSAEAARIADEITRGREGSAARVIGAADRDAALIRGLQDYARAVSGQESP